MANGVWPRLHAEMFPTRARDRPGTQIGFAISGGVAPAGDELAGADLHNAVLPAVFTAAMCWWRWVR